MAKAAELIDAYLRIKDCVKAGGNAAIKAMTAEQFAGLLLRTTGSAQHALALVKKSHRASIDLERAYPGLTALLKSVDG